MKYAAICLVTMLVPMLAGGCNDSAEPNAGRVVSLELSRPAGLDVMLDWPADGVDSDSGRALFIGAYQSPAGELRVWGGVGERTSDGDVLSDADAFDVAATRSDLGIYTASFELPVWAQRGQTLRFDMAVLFELELGDSGMVPTSARLLGVLTPEVANRMEVSRLDMSLAELLSAAGAQPDYDVDGDGAADSWVAEGHLVAEPTWLE